MSTARRVPCRLCSKPLLWGMTLKQTRIPLDSVAPVYRVQLPGADGIPPQYLLAEPAAKLHQGSTDPLAAPFPDLMVSHFATCPQAGEFSKSKSIAAERAIELAAIAEQFYQARGNAEATRDVAVRYQLYKAGG